ncbi:MAG: molybdopterin-dependent oxidoreductase [bacterium]|nr:molybdopterin-dependent oxidoreductase [bacterium]
MSDSTSRRNFIKAGAVFGALGGAKIALGDIRFNTGESYSPKTAKKREGIPSSCWQCVSRDAITGYIEDGRLVKIEGNSKSIRNRGKICSKGQAGINQVYDPDRILYPLKRVGKRGEGKWKQITWDEALNELTGRLKKLLDEGTPEKFMFHYGRLKGSDSKIVGNFLTAYGTATKGNHTSICEGGKWTGQELTWGKHYDIWDFEHTNLIVNFGSNFFEAHTSHVQAAQRAANALANGTKMYTFDVRLSNTAAKSDEWIPIKPGADLAVMLAMANVIMEKGLYDKEFIDTWTNTTVADLKAHLKQYTPSWAQGISGVPAGKITQIAEEFAKAKPAILVTYRGAVAHYNGVMAERAKFMLEAICGYINEKGGTNQPVGAKWSYPKAKGKTKKLKIVDGFPGAIAYPTHHANHQVLKMIKDGSHGRPEIYMIHCYNPAYVNGDCAENIEILKDESLIPYIVSVDAFMSESTALADLILPDVTYIERWTWDDMASFALIPEYYIRQPLVKPLGETRQFQDVVCDLATRLGLDIACTSTLDFMQKSCEKSKIDFDAIKRVGVWSDPNAKPKYHAHAKEIKEADLTADGVIFDEDTGVYWKWAKSKAKSEEEAVETGYRKTKNAYKGYVGQKIGDKVYKGFKPDKLNKSGKIELYSELLKDKNFDPFPAWMEIPEHKNLTENQLILTTYKVATQVHSRTQNCMWLTELYHENPAWINPATAAKLGVTNGQRVMVKSSSGEFGANLKVTDAITPGVIAVSFHLGHWDYGEFASGKKSSGGHVCVPDCEYKWWDKYGDHPNFAIPNSPDPIAGQQRWMDTVVEIQKI